jgi:hypothetical protein
MVEVQVVDGGLPLDADPAWAWVSKIEVHADKELAPEPF